MDCFASLAMTINGRVSRLFETAISIHPRRPAQAKRNAGPITTGRSALAESADDVSQTKHWSSPCAQDVSERAAFVRLSPTESPKRACLPTARESSSVGFQSARFVLIS
jgi:hypothetical protein